MSMLSWIHMERVDVLQTFSATPGCRTSSTEFQMRLTCERSTHAGAS